MAAMGRRARDRKPEVLILNSNFEPIAVASVFKAIKLLLKGKAEVVEEDSRTVRTARLSFKAPSVVRLNRYVRRPTPHLKVSRRNILARDDYTCQYCGKRSKNLTVDHVIPRRRGGATTWENLVSCCPRCNSRKGDRAPWEVGMKLIRQPKRPKYIPLFDFALFVSLARRGKWEQYLKPFYDAMEID